MNYEKLGDLIEIKHGFAFSSQYFQADGPYVLLTPGNFYEEGGFKLRADQKHYDGPVSAAFVLEPGDLLVAMTEQGEGLLGSTAFVPDGKPCLHNQRLGLITSKPEAAVNLRYIYYVLNWRNVRQQIRATSSGAKVRHTSPSRIYAVDIPKHSFETQCRIAEILGAYDDLIEVNRRRIAVLDEMARGLFDEWFMRFRFPGYEEVAIEGTPDGPLPAGWHRAKVGEVLQKIKRPIKIQKQEYIATGSVPCIDQGANFIGGYTDNQEAIIASPLPMCVFGDHTRILKFITFPFASGADGTQLLYPTDELTPVYLYLALINVDLSNQHYARHFKFLKEQMLVVPPRAIVECFSRFATPIFDAIQNHRFQSEKLAVARDLLLPRLISGQLSVTQAERELEAA